MTTEVKRWQVVCLAENKLVEVFSPDVPTLCPNDHPDRSIDTSRVVLLETIKSNRVEVVDGVPGQFQHTSLRMSLPEGDPDSKSVFNFTWPMNIQIWRTEFMPGPEHKGDTINVCIDPDRTIGVLTQNGNIGDTELYLSPSAFGYPGLIRGIEVNLTDGVNTQHVGRLIAFDSTIFKMTVEKPLEYNFSAMSTYFQVCLHIVKDAYISQPLLSYGIGQKGLAAKSLPANIVMRVIWTNGSGAAKDVTFILEYNYL